MSFVTSIAHFRFLLAGTHDLSIIWSFAPQCSHYDKSIQLLFWEHNVNGGINDKNLVAIEMAKSDVIMSSCVSILWIFILAIPKSKTQGMDLYRSEILIYQPNSRVDWSIIFQDTYLELVLIAFEVLLEFYLEDDTTHLEVSVAERSINEVVTKLLLCPRYRR